MSLKLGKQKERFIFNFFVCVNLWRYDLRDGLLPHYYKIKNQHVKSTSGIKKPMSKPCGGIFEIYSNFLKYLKCSYFKSIFHFLSWLLVYVRTSEFSWHSKGIFWKPPNAAASFVVTSFTPPWGSNCAASSVVVRHCHCLSNSVSTASCLGPLCGKFNLFVCCSCSLIGFIHTCLMFIILWICWDCEFLFV